MIAYTAVSTSSSHNNGSHHSHRPKTRRNNNWCKRWMRKYEITPGKLGAYLLFLALLIFLLYHYFTSRPIPPLTPYRMHDPHATHVVTEAGVIEVVEPVYTIIDKKDTTTEEQRQQQRWQQQQQPLPTKTQDQLNDFYTDRLKSGDQQMDDLLNQGREVKYKPIGGGGDRTSAILKDLPPTAPPPSQIDGPVSTTPTTSSEVKKSEPTTPPVTTPTKSDEDKTSASKPTPTPVVPTKEKEKGADSKPTESPESTLAREQAIEEAKANEKPVAVKEPEPDTPAALIPTTKTTPEPTTPTPSSPPRTFSSGSFSSLTSPSSPLASSIDPSRLFDTPTRRSARQAQLISSQSEDLPPSVRNRKVNTKIFDETHREKQLNEEYREVVEERKVHVEAPGIVTSFTSPDGGLELSLILSADGRLGYSTKLHGAYSTIARTMQREGVIANTEEVEGTFMMPALLDLSVDDVQCLFDTTSTTADGKKQPVELNLRLTKGFSYWHPIPRAERMEYAESFTQVTIWNTAMQSSTTTTGNGKKKSCPAGTIYEFRLFNIGFAVRSLVRPFAASVTPPNPLYANEGQYVPITFSLGLRLQDGVQKSKCVASNLEEPYITLPCRELRDAMMTPVMMEVSEKLEGEGVKHAGQHSNGPSHFAILQAAGQGFVQSIVASITPVDKMTQTQMTVTARGEAPFAPTSLDAVGTMLSPLDEKTILTPTSWHVIALSSSLRGLVMSNHLVPLLCPPPSTQHESDSDARWVPHGKSYRITRFTTFDTIAVMDWVKQHNFQVAHFDAGWYGDEYKKESSAKQVLKAFQNKLDMKVVGDNSREKDVRVSLYVNELALRDTADLIKIYPDWGISGVKFGFVEVGDPRAMRVLHERVIAFGRVGGMFINIHDSYRPRGLTRTYPYLVAQEGVRGEERKPDATHHTLLPFVRFLQGSADYTPRFLNGAGLQCTKAHQLSVPLILYSPIQSLFWAEPLSAVNDAVTSWNKELTIWTRMPSVWDDTRWLSAEIGSLAIVARRNGRDWYVAAITNTHERVAKIDLNQLWKEWYGHPALTSSSTQTIPLPLTEGYVVHSYRDSPWKGRFDPFNVKVQARQLFWLAPPKDLWINGKEPKIPPGLGMIQDGIFSLDLAPSGGHTLFITPATPTALKEVAQ